MHNEKERGVFSPLSSFCNEWIIVTPHTSNLYPPPVAGSPQVRGRSGVHLKEGLGEVSALLNRCGYLVPNVLAKGRVLTLGFVGSNVGLLL